MEIKVCVVCDARFERRHRYSQAQWEAQRCCSVRCANVLRAHTARGAGANFRPGPEHGWKVRAGRARSVAGRRAGRKRYRKQLVRMRAEAERNAREQLTLWTAVCSCGAILPPTRQYCEACYVLRKRAHRKRWNSKHPDYQRLYKRGYAALKAAALGSCSHEQAQARFDYYGGACAYCRVELKRDAGPREWHWDHVIPLARGGTNWPANLRPACADCNRRKGTRHYSDFVGIAARLSKFVEA